MAREVTDTGWPDAHRARVVQANTAAGLAPTPEQLAAQLEAYDKYRPLMGKHIVAHGQLFAAQTGHHHTGVLLTVSDLAAAN